MSTDAEVIDAVSRAFSGIEKPEHFTDHQHCQECEEHDQLLLQHNRESLQVNAVNNPGWDPISFCSPQGKAYYLPSLVKFALAEPNAEALPYWQQLLFHLEGNGPNNELIVYCSKTQRRAIAEFLAHLIENRASEIESLASTNEALKTHEYWANAA